MKKLAVLISNKGTGSNLLAIIDAIEDKKINAKVIAVVSDTKAALGLTHARKHKIPIKISAKKENLLKILEKLNQIQVDINIIKESLEEDGELTDWAKEELKKAREAPEEDYISQEEVRKIISRK